jgi:hypothetical protein
MVLSAAVVNEVQWTDHADFESGIRRSIIVHPVAENTHVLADFPKPAYRNLFQGKIHGGTPSPTFLN